MFFYSSSYLNQASAKASASAPRKLPHDPPSSITLVDHVPAETTMSSQQAASIEPRKENQKACLARKRGFVHRISLASKYHSCCLRSDGSEIYSAAFSGSGAAAGAGASPASLVSVVAAPLSPPLGASASDEVQRV